jgi:outer membrane protein
MRKNTLSIAVALAAIASSAAAQTNSVYVGGAYINVNSKAPPLEGGDPVPPPGALISVGNASTVAFGYVYRFADQFGLEFALGVPPKHKGYGEGFIAPFGQISSVKQVAPTAFLNYYFGEAGATLRPFLGLGLNFTRFTDATSTQSGDAASGGPTQLKLSDSWGLAVHGGATYAIDKHWHVLGSIAYADVQSDLTATTTTFEGDVIRTTHIDFRPVVFTLALGYTF